MKSHHSLKPLGFANNIQQPKSLPLSQRSQRKTFNMCSLLFSGFCPYRSVDGSTPARPRVRPGPGHVPSAKVWDEEIPTGNEGSCDHPCHNLKLSWNYPEISGNVANIITSLIFLWWSLELLEQSWTSHAASCSSIVKWDSESQLAHLSCQLWRIVDPSPSVSSTHHRDLCPAIWSTSRCRPTSFEHVWTICPLLLLPELVEPGFGCLIPSGFFLRETGSSQDQFRLSSNGLQQNVLNSCLPENSEKKMNANFTCTVVTCPGDSKWVRLKTRYWSHHLNPWNGHLGAH